MVVIGQKWLYSGKSGSFRAKLVLIGQKMLFLGKVDVLKKKWF